MNKECDKDTQAVISNILWREVKRATKEGLTSLEEKVTRYYEVGYISVSQLARLDVYIMERLAE